MSATIQNVPAKKEPVLNTNIEINKGTTSNNRTVTKELEPKELIDKIKTFKSKISNLKQENLELNEKIIALQQESSEFKSGITQAIKNILKEKLEIENELRLLKNKSEVQQHQPIYMPPVGPTPLMRSNSFGEVLFKIKKLKEEALKKGDLVKQQVKLLEKCQVELKNSHESRAMELELAAKLQQLVLDVLTNSEESLSTPMTPLASLTLLTEEIAKLNADIESSITEYKLLKESQLITNSEEIKCEFSKYIDMFNLLKLTFINGNFASTGIDLNQRTSNKEKLQYCLKFNSVSNLFEKTSGLLKQLLLEFNSDDARLKATGIINSFLKLPTSNLIFSIPYGGEKLKTDMTTLPKEFQNVGDHIISIAFPTSESRNN